MAEYHAQPKITNIDSVSGSSNSFRVAAASDLRFSMAEIIQNFKKESPAAKIEMTFGSSGRFLAQIRQGAPFDIFLSADINYPKLLFTEGFAGSEVVPYAVGSLVIWKKKGPATFAWKEQEATQQQLKSIFLENRLQKIALSNPAHTPYGKKALEYFKNAALLPLVSERFVTAESVAHAAQMLESGNIDLGVIALSVAQHQSMKSKGDFLLVPQTLYEPLVQGMVLTKQGQNKAVAKKFFHFILNSESQKILLSHGFKSPKDSLQSSAQH